MGNVGRAGAWIAGLVVCVVISALAFYYLANLSGWLSGWKLL